MDAGKEVLRSNIHGKPTMRKRGLLIALPLAVGFWAGLYYILYKIWELLSQ